MTTEKILLINHVFAIGFLSTFLISVLFMVLHKIVFKEEKVTNKMQDIAMIFMWATIVLFFSLGIISGIYQYLQIHK